MNRGDLLARLIGSIDVEAEVLVIVNRIGPVDPSVEEALAALVEKPRGPVRLAVQRMEGNLGVAGSWNRIMDWAEGECLISNSDIEFSPGVLREAMAAVERRREVVVHHLWAAACFYVTADFQRRLGWFDENFYPAYREDQEMALRAGALGVERAILGELEARITHGVSQTRLSASGPVRRFIGRANQLGGEYFQRRWGVLPPPGVDIPEKRFPFDDATKSPADWTLDLAMRGKIARLCLEMTGFECPVVFHRTEGGLCS